MGPEHRPCAPEARTGSVSGQRMISSPSLARAKRRTALVFSVGLSDAVATCASPHSPSARRRKRQPERPRCRQANYITGRPPALMLRGGPCRRAATSVTRAGMQRWVGSGSSATTSSTSGSRWRIVSQFEVRPWFERQLLVELAPLYLWHVHPGQVLAGFLTRDRCGGGERALFGLLAVPAAVGHAHLTGGPHDLLACASRQRNHKGHGQNHRQEHVSASLIHSCVPFRAGRTPSAVASTRASQQARRIAGAPPHPGSGRWHQEHREASGFMFSPAPDSPLFYGYDPGSASQTPGP